jgi:hypothetical protein
MLNVCVQSCVVDVNDDDVDFFLHEQVFFMESVSTIFEGTILLSSSSSSSSPKVFLILRCSC